MGRIGKEASRIKRTRFKIVHGVKAKDKLVASLNRALDKKTISSASWKRVRIKGKATNMWSFEILKKKLSKKRRKK